MKHWNINISFLFTEVYFNSFFLAEFGNKIRNLYVRLRFRNMYMFVYVFTNEIL